MPRMFSEIPVMIEMIKLIMKLKFRLCYQSLNEIS